MPTTVCTASTATVGDVLAKYEAEFATTAEALENGEFSLWVGSGISRNAPNLGDLIENALEFLRVRAVDVATEATYLPPFKRLLSLARLNPDDVVGQFGTPISAWPQLSSIRDELWNNYSRVLDIRVPSKPSDFMLWEAIDVCAAFAHPSPPAAEHLCIAILILEGAVHTVASANWDGFIEAAVSKLSSGAVNVLQTVVDPDHLRDVAGRARLLKFHGCIVQAALDPVSYRKYLTGSTTQISEWISAPLFRAMRNRLVDVATNQKTLVLGLSIQDQNLHSIFVEAKQANPWPWPCEPDAPGHVFCEDVIRNGQDDVLKIVYGEAYNDHLDEIRAGTHLQAWGEQVLVALVMKLLTDKLVKLMELALAEVGKPAMSAELAALLNGLRDHISQFANGDRTAFINAAVGIWSRMLSLFRRGTTPTNPEAYEVLTQTVPRMLPGDHNAQATRLGSLGIALGLIQHGRAAGRWEVLPAGTGDIGEGAFTMQGTWAGAPVRPLFVVKSASEAIALDQRGAFAGGNAIVLHADSVWHSTVGSGGAARRPRGAPGRTGKVRTTHVSIAHLVDTSADVDGLKRQFMTEATV